MYRLDCLGKHVWIRSQQSWKKARTVQEKSHYLENIWAIGLTLDNPKIHVKEFPFSHYFSSFFTFPPSLYTQQFSSLLLFSIFLPFSLPHLNSKQSSHILSATLTTVLDCKSQSSILKMKMPYSPVSARLAQLDNDYILKRHVFEAAVKE